MIAEGERAERLKKGCRINGVTYNPEVWTPQEAQGVDLLVVCLKYGALPEAMGSIRTAVGENTTVMSLMNGVDSEELIAAEIGAAPVLPSLIKVASHQEEDGYILILRQRLVSFSARVKHRIRANGCRRSKNY